MNQLVLILLFNLLVTICILFDPGSNLSSFLLLATRFSYQVVIISLNGECKIENS